MEKAVLSERVGTLGFRLKPKQLLGLYSARFFWHSFCSLKVLKGFFMRTLLIILSLLGSLSLHAEDSGNYVMGVKIKRFGREASEGRGTVEDHKGSLEANSFYYRPKTPREAKIFSDQKLNHPLGEGLVYPKRKPITFW